MKILVVCQIIACGSYFFIVYDFGQVGSEDVPFKKGGKKVNFACWKRFSGLPVPTSSTINLFHFNKLTII